jgi:hypothetical protein
VFRRGRSLLFIFARRQYRRGLEGHDTSPVVEPVLATMNRWKLRYFSVSDDEAGRPIETATLFVRLQ